MRKLRWLALPVLLGIALPVLACNDPNAPRVPDGTDDDEDGKRPDENDDTAFLPTFSAEPIIV